MDNFMTSTAANIADVICLQETWLCPVELDPVETVKEGFEQHSVKIGKGKGITTIFQRDYQLDEYVADSNYQLNKIKSETLDIINVYRSNSANNVSFLEDLTGMISPGRETFVVGDFNLCYIAERTHQVFETLRTMGFVQMVTNPTHVEGRMIDLVFSNSFDYEVQQQAQYFTDHDQLQVFRGKQFVS